HHVARLITTAVPRHAAVAACVIADIGTWAARYQRKTDEGQPIRAISRIMNETARIMKATPPYEPATWLGFSALKRGYRAPRPVASPTSASAMKNTAAADT